MRHLIFLISKSKPLISPRNAELCIKPTRGFLIPGFLYVSLLPEVNKDLIFQWFCLSLPSKQKRQILSFGGEFAETFQRSRALKAVFRKTPARTHSDIRLPRIFYKTANEVRTIQDLPEHREISTTDDLYARSVKQPARRRKSG